MYTSAFIGRSLAQTKIYVFALSVYLVDDLNISLISSTARCMSPSLSAIISISFAIRTTVAVL